MQKSYMHKLELADSILNSLGFAHWRSGQRESIADILQGRDSLVLMSTGGGKSLIYQILSKVLGKPVLTISPLIALMQDQVQQARKLGFSSACMTSLMSATQREDELKKYLSGNANLLFVSPERLSQKHFLDSLMKRPPGLIAVDEAHCISMWGHDFRPDYRKISSRLRTETFRPPILALTATASEEVRIDILQALAMQKAEIHAEGLERANLTTAVKQVFSEQEKLEWVLKCRSALAGSGIVYFSLIRTLERARTLMQQAGHNVLVYHGDLPRSAREKNQLQFMNSDSLIFATNAFGLGVHKQDVRFVTHWEIPGSLESWYQEAGRAGRDGLPALCLLLYQSEDAAIQEDFQRNQNPDAEYLRAVISEISLSKSVPISELKAKLNTKFRSGSWDWRLESALNILSHLEITAEENGRLKVIQMPGSALDTYLSGKLRLAAERIGRISHFALSRRCRFQLLLRHFSGIESAACGHCDNCKPDQPILAKISNDIPPAGNYSDIESKKSRWLRHSKFGVCEILSENEKTYLIEDAEQLRKIRIAKNEPGITLI